MVTLPACEYRVTQKDGAVFVALKIPPDRWAGLSFELSSIKGNQISAKIAKPFKPRTTGEKSQNNHAWGHCVEIARALAMEVYEVEYIAKVRAIKRGYPVSTHLGLAVPKSQADISTEECAYLIEEYHMIAAENGVTLTESEPEILAKPEGYYRKENDDALKPVKRWEEMTRAEQAEADPERFDKEMQLDIF